MVVAQRNNPRNTTESLKGAASNRQSFRSSISGAIPKAILQMIFCCERLGKTGDGSTLVPGLLTRKPERAKGFSKWQSNT